MANLKQSAVTGQSWHRCSNVNIRNPESPERAVITFTSDEKLHVADKSLTLGTKQLSDAYDPAATIVLLDPDTLKPTGQTMPEQLVYLALFSKYVATSKKDDAKEASQAVMIAQQQAAQVAMQQAQSAAETLRADAAVIEAKAYSAALAAAAKGKPADAPALLQAYERDKQARMMKIGAEAQAVFDANNAAAAKAQAQAVIDAQAAYDAVMAA